MEDVKKVEFEEKCIVIGNRVLIRILIDDGIQKRESGLIISVNNNQKTNRGIVVKIGAGCSDESIKISEGDVVIYDKYAGHAIVVNDVQYIVIPIEDILLLEPKIDG